MRAQNHRIKHFLQKIYNNFIFHFKNFYTYYRNRYKKTKEKDKNNLKYILYKKDYLGIIILNHRKSILQLKMI